jgi:phosphoribosyl-ATP pyrophosphohydrolase
MSHDPLGSAASLGAVISRLSETIDARAGADPATSWTAKLLFGGPGLCARKLGEEGVEAALAVASESDAKVVAEAADVIFHLLVALRSRGVTLDQVADVLTAREGQSGVAEKASRPD